MMDDEDMVLDLNVEESSTPTPGALPFPRIQQYIWLVLNFLEMCANPVIQLARSLR